MSSRALRKAQKQREEEQALEALKKEAEEMEESDSEDEARPQQSAFALLGGDDDDANDGSGSVEEHAVTGEPPDHAEDASDTILKAPQKRKKPKKKKAKAKASSKPGVEANAGDDIDAALAELKVSNDQANGHHELSDAVTMDPVEADACKILAVNQQNLHADNEMRRLFGRTAMDINEDEEDGPRGGRRQQNRQRQMGGLAGALGRQGNAQGGRSTGLALLGLRRNPFITGKEDWPSGTSGGLGMEVVEKDENGIVEYRFVHNRAYQEVQNDFDVCVQAMDPERMVRLLQLNPYHISTLLQVSEIAMREGDHSTSGDLLERALFTFGRSLQSTFTDKLTHGEVHMDFRRPENREFWLAASRYITNLTMRSTWRTVLEWSRLLLSLDPINDPYQIRLVVDQYAIRARQPQILLDLYNNQVISKEWKDLPNVQFSVGLALMQTEQVGKGKQQIFTAANRYPWFVFRLFQELNIDAPPGVWGKTPRTEWEKLHAELYAVRAKDLWQSPEANGVLVEVSSAVAAALNDSPVPTNEITLDEARHVLLTDKRELIALLPGSITRKLSSTSDPLPPEDNLPSYQTRFSQATTQSTMSGAGVPVDLRSVFTSLRQLLPALRARQIEEEGQAAPENEFNADESAMEALEQLLRQGGATDEQLEEARRMVEEVEADEARERAPGRDGTT